jgi:hypothetical protein
MVQNLLGRLAIVHELEIALKLLERFLLEFEDAIQRRCERDLGLRDIHIQHDHELALGKSGLEPLELL